DRSPSGPPGSGPAGRPRPSTSTCSPGSWSRVPGDRSGPRRCGQAGHLLADLPEAAGGVLVAGGRRRFGLPLVDEITARNPLDIGGGRQVGDGTGPFLGGDVRDPV